MNVLYQDGRVCDLSSEGITSPRKDFFQGLNNLQTLWLDDDNLTCLPSLPNSLEQLYLIDTTTNSVNDHNLPPCKPSKPFDETEEPRHDQRLANLPGLWIFSLFQA